MKEVLDAWHGCDESAGEVRKGRRTDDHQQADAVPHDRIAFVRFVADAAIMGERDPAMLTYRLQPHLIGRGRRKVIPMSLDCQTA